MFVNCDLNITINKVRSTLRKLDSQVGTTTTRRNRERWAVILKKEGKTYYTVDGKEILSDKYHPVIMSKGSTYSWRCVEPGECIIIDFESSEEYGAVYPFEITDCSFIVNAFMKIEKKLNTQNMHSQMECIHLLYGVILFLLKSVKKQYVPNDKKDILKPATDYIANNYYDNGITNEMLSKKCGISTVYFRKIFEKVYGISPIKHLNQFRIEKAKSMLVSDFESIGQIAESVGYSSIYHFSKMFKLYTGMSPVKYKNTHL